MRGRIIIFLGLLIFITTTALHAEFIRDDSAVNYENATIVTYFPSPNAVYTLLNVTGSATLATDPVAMVGIGTDSPGAKLDVSGNVIFDGGVVAPAQGLYLAKLDQNPQGMWQEGLLWIDNNM
jgi:hypothetical protein